MSAADHCPTCQTTVVPDRHGRCSWCGDTCRKKAAGGKPVGKHLQAITPELLDIAHGLYDRGYSMRQVASMILDRTGYANVNAATASLYEAFRIRGWSRRERIAAVKARCTTHGRAARAAKGTDDFNALRRERRAAKNAELPPCVEPDCNRPSRDGLDYCHLHDPELQARRVQGILAGRAKRTAKFHRWGDVGQPILDWARQQRYPAMRLAERAGVPEATIRRTLRKADDDPITPELLQKLLAGIATNPAAEAATTESAAS